MEMIYEWLYENYYQPRAGEILDGYGEMGAIAAEAERRLLAGEGGDIERQDAINTLCRINGTAAFTAGVCFGGRLLMDAGFVSQAAVDGIPAVV